MADNQGLYAHLFSLVVDLLASTFGVFEITVVSIDVLGSHV